MKRFYPIFKLNWDINNVPDFNNALDVFKHWAQNNKSCNKSYSVKDVIKKIDSQLYDRLSRGDKCRLGRAVSTLYNNYVFPELKRGKKKGSTNTYYII